MRVLSEFARESSHSQFRTEDDSNKGSLISVNETKKSCERINDKLNETIFNTSNSVFDFLKSGTGICYVRFASVGRYFYTFNDLDKVEETMED